MTPIAKAASYLALTILLGCSGETPVKVTSTAPGIQVTQADTLNFAQDGDTINLAVGEEISVKLDLPNGIKNTAITWQPIDGWYDGPIEEFRT